MRSIFTSGNNNELVYNTHLLGLLSLSLSLDVLKLHVRPHHHSWLWSRREDEEVGL